ncbi:MAG: TRAP transporter small permease [Deltaproteobacteria bacterium]|nr:TRAP transporter small permease [Deltaproteobacteria bacterium]MBW1927800.1 TRAP transporter small permease [Deltaproteobacteria bacterium]
MKGFWSIIEWTLDKQKVIGACCLVGMTFLTCVDVVGRFFRHPVFGSVELVGYMSTLSVAMALPYTQKVKGHIGVEILFRLLKPKVQALIDICTSLLSLAFFIAVTWRMAVYARTLHESGEVSMNLEFPEYAIVYVVAFCFLVFVLIIVRDVIENWKKLKE